MTITLNPKSKKESKKIKAFLKVIELDFDETTENENYKIAKSYKTKK